MGGKADFAPYGLRYKLMLAGMDRSMPVTGLLPYNTDLMRWVWNNYVVDDAKTAARELWHALNLGFFMMRGSELGNIRMKGIRPTHREGSDCHNPNIA